MIFFFEFLRFHPPSRFDRPIRYVELGEARFGWGGFLSRRSAVDTVRNVRLLRGQEGRVGDVGREIVILLEGNEGSGRFSVMETSGKPGGTRFHGCTRTREGASRFALIAPGGSVFFDYAETFSRGEKKKRKKKSVSCIVKPLRGNGVSLFGEIGIGAEPARGWLNSPSHLPPLYGLLFRF